MVICYLGVGSNLGNRRKNIEAAIEYLRRDRYIKVTKISRLYETEAIGGPPQGKFLNGAVEVESRLSPQRLLYKLKDIELKLGRTKLQSKYPNTLTGTSGHRYPIGHRWGPRTIDLDILLYGDLVLEEEDLRIPHRLMDRRPFVLRPLCEIAPYVLHPLRKQTIAELLAEYEDDNKD